MTASIFIHIPSATKRQHGNFLDDECAAYMAQNDRFLVPTIITYQALREHGVKAGMAEDLVAKVCVCVCDRCGCTCLCLALGGETLTAFRPTHAHNRWETW